MPTTVAIKTIGDGQLANTKGTLYTAPSSTQTIVKHITVVNTDSAARTFNLYFNNGTSRQITAVDQSLAIGAIYEWDGTLTLEAGDLIEGVGEVASQLDYVISGVENS